MCRFAAWAALGGIVASCPQAVGDDWRGFRGLEHQGVAPSGSRADVLSWSSRENVRWATPIRGHGNSSPVASGGRVYVSTAYPTAQATMVGNALAVARFLLVTFLASSGIALLVRACGTKRAAPGSLADAQNALPGVCCNTLGLAAFSLAIAGTAFLVLYGPDVLDYQRCPIRGWLASGVLVTLCFVLADFRIGSRSPGGFGMGILGLGYSGLVMAAIPSKEHAYHDGMLSNNSTVVLAVAAVPALFGTFCIVGFLSNAPMPCIPRQSLIVRGTRHIVVHHVFVAAIMVAIAAAAGIRFFTGVVRAGNSFAWEGWLAWCLGAFLIGILSLGWSLDRHSHTTGEFHRRAPGRGLGYLGLVLGTAAMSMLAVAVLFGTAIDRSAYLAYHAGNPRWTAESGPWGIPTFAFACVSSFAIAFVAWIRRWRGAEARPSRVFRVAALALATSQLLAVGWLSGGQTLVRAIVCLDEDTGKTVWSCEALPGPEGPLHRLNSAATPTPVLSGDRVCAFFGSVGLMCCGTDGDLKWTNETIRFASPYGTGTSPVVLGDILVLVNAMPEAPRIYALSCENGELLWQADMMVGVGEMPFWGQSRTPLIRVLDGKATLLVWGPGGLAGYDLQGGQMRWCHPIGAGGGDMVASPTVDKTHVFCAGTRETVALALTKLDGREDPVVWRTKARGPNCASPLALNGLLLFVTDEGIATCLDAETGEQLWRTRLKGEYYASPIAVGDLVYFCNAAGVTTVVAADREFRRLAENQLREQTLASFAPVNGRLLVRTSSRLWCIGTGSHAGPEIVSSICSE